MSEGTSVRESIQMIQQAGATPCGVTIALDRQEKAAEGGQDQPRSAVQYVRDQLHLQVVPIASLQDLLQYLSTTRDPALAEHTARVAAYRDKFGV